MNVRTTSIINRYTCNIFSNWTKANDSCCIPYESLVCDVRVNKMVDTRACQKPVSRVCPFYLTLSL